MINPRLTDRRRHHLTKLLKGSILILQSGKRQLLKVIGQISYALCLYYVINVIHLLYSSAHGLVEVCGLTVDPAVDIVTDILPDPYVLHIHQGYVCPHYSQHINYHLSILQIDDVVFLPLYYAGFLRVQDILDDLLADAAQSGAALARAAWPLRLLGGAAAGELPALVGLVLGTVLCFAVFCKLLEKPYLRRMTARKGTARTA